MKKICPDPSWLKVTQRPVVYATGQPDFIELGSNDEWEIDNEVAALRAFTNGYDWRNSAERTDEYGFKRSIRILPGIDYIIGKAGEDTAVPWGTYPFNYDPTLLATCRSLIEKLLIKFSAATGTPWQCTTIQIAGMQPGVILKPHIDGYFPHTIVEKIHIPLSTNERCRQITFDKESCLARSIDHLLPGNAYCINNLEPHSACNLGSDIRWHVIVDLIESQAWIDLKAQAKRDYPEIASVYLVNPEYTRHCNDQFFAAFDRVHGTLEPRRYIHSLFSGAPYYTRNHERAHAT